MPRTDAEVAAAPAAVAEAAQTAAAVTEAYAALLQTRRMADQCQRQPPLRTG